MSKILIISQHYFPENFRITDIAETLVKLGNEVTVLCGYPNYPDGEIFKGYEKRKLHREENINGVNVIRCYERPRKHDAINLFLNYYTICLSLKRKAKKLKEKYDYVLINQLSPVMQSWAGLAYAKKHHVKCFLYCYDLWPDSLAAGGIKKDSFIYKYYYRVSNKIYKKVDKILVTSKNFIPYFEDFHHIDATRLVYLPQYCEDLYQNLESDKTDQVFNYVFAGNIGKMQSVETIIRAAELIKDDKQIKIHVVGDGSSFKECQELAASLGLDNVIFYGRRPLEEMPMFYKMASAMLVTLTKNDVVSKTLPGKVQSYMAAGKPIIGAINGETKEIIAEAKCGLVCEAENYQELARLMQGFKHEDIESLATNAREYYQKNFTKDLFFERLIKELED